MRMSKGILTAGIAIVALLVAANLIFIRKNSQSIIDRTVKTFSINDYPDSKESGSFAPLRIHFYTELAASDRTSLIKRKGRVEINGSVENSFIYNAGNMGPLKKRAAKIMMTTKDGLRIVFKVRGPSVKNILERSRIKPGAKFLIAHTPHGKMYTIPLEKITRNNALIATESSEHMSDTDGNRILILVASFQGNNTVTPVTSIEISERPANVSGLDKESARPFNKHQLD